MKTQASCDLSLSLQPYIPKCAYVNFSLRIFQTTWIWTNISADAFYTGGFICMYSGLIQDFKLEPCKEGNQSKEDQKCDVVPTTTGSICETDMGIAQIIEALKMCLGKRKLQHGQHGQATRADTAAAYPQSLPHKHKSNLSDRPPRESVCHKCQGRPKHQVVYVPGSSHTSSSDREPMALPPVQRDRRHPLQQDLTLNLPPSIPISLDGEEGYSRYSQCLLKCDVSNESVRPPPNRTIFDREPPPPYRSNSAGLLDSYSDCSRSSDYRNPYRDCGSSQYIMPSCQVSENNNTRNTAHWNSGLYSSVTGAVIPDALPGLPFQHQDASQARADRNGPPSILAVPTSGHGLSSPNASTTLATVPLLPSYNMVVGQTNRETES